MKPHHPSRVIAGAALLALVVGFIAPFPVLAEESSPPAEPTAYTTLPPDAAAPASEATPAPVEDPLAPEGEPTEPVPPEAPTDDGAPSDAAAPAEPGLAELLEFVPSDTTIAVVDEAGELLPLVSAEAAEVIAGGDPIWCPASVNAPTPGLNGCSPGFWGADGMSDLIDYLSNDATEPAMDGIIWIEAGDHFDTLPIVLDGSVGGDIGFTTMSLYKLTLRGGWDPITNKVIPGETSDFSVQLIIRNWHADVTLSDIVVEGATTAAGSNALEVNTTGNISLQRVRSEGNDGNGAWLLNGTGGSTGTVTVTDSQFLDNDGGWGGLYVESLGSITLSRVIAEGNSNGYGAYLRNDNALTPQPVAIGVLSAFNDNGADGLYVYTLGAITAADLTASDNDGWGAQLWNYNAPSAQAVTLTGTNIFTDNYSGGLNIASAGAIKLNSIIADSNNTGTGPGAQLVNTGATSNQPITLTGTSTFKYNASDGLYIASNGPVTLNNITASGNASDKGLEISTSSSPTAGVTLTGTNSFNDNYDDGLYVYSNGLIKLNSVTALGNGFGSGNGYGATLYNAASASSPGVTFTGTNNLSGNRYQGLYLLTRGPVAISNLTASDNSSYGANINNTASGTASPQKVTLSGKNVFAGNANNGLLVYSYGAIAASSLTVTGNGLAGTGSNGAYLQNGGGTKAQPVTLSGVNLFTGNGRTGLEIQSLGAIKVSSLTTSGNGAGGAYGHGAYLRNSSAATPGAGISLSGTNVLSSNHGAGLGADSLGPITLANLTASGNGGDGVSAGTGLPASPQKITFTGAGAFNDNGGYGLNLGGYGAITLASLSASGNGAFGVSIYNASGDTAQPVTLSGSFVLNDNDNVGLFIQSYGAVKVSNLTAVGNGSNGVVISNNYEGMTGGITLSGKNVISDNYYSGLAVYTRGPIAVSSLSANGNGIGGSSGYGADINNGQAASAQKVTFTGTNTFHGNHGFGLYLSAGGPVTLSNISANNTINGSGVYLSNTNVFSGPVTLTGISSFSQNQGYGMSVYSDGAINLNTTRLEASGNGVTWGYGLQLNNAGADTAQKVTLKGPAILLGNYGEGLAIHSKGAITINNLTSSGSTHGLGALLYNNNPGAVGGVTLGGTNWVQNNAYAGVTISSYGPVTVNSLTATGNGFYALWGGGLSIDNTTSPATAQAVKLTGVNNLSGNYSSGLRIRSNGAIAINSLTASNNAHSYGADLVNEYAGSVGGITLTGTNTFNGNYGTGLEAYSLGAISANNLTASGNGSSASGWGYGAILSNQNALTPQAVKLTGTNTFNNNWQTGLDVSTDGAISINNLTASHNGLSGSGYGAYLLNYDGDPLAQNVTLTGSSTFAENDMDGLFISSDGVVALTKVYADGNGGSGLYVINNAGGVTVTCGSFIDNIDNGVYASTSGVLKLIGVIAVSNNSLDGNIQLAGGGSLSLVRACPLG